MRLENKIAVVTGGGSGFGEAIVRRFAAEGAAVLVADIDLQAARRVAESVGGKARSVAADVSRSDAVRAMFEAAISGFGGVDIVVNNAGVPQRNGPMLQVDEATFDHIFAVNVKSIYLSAIHGVPLLVQRGGGVIINTSSTAALRPRPGLTWYNGSKGAVNTLTKSMAVELAPQKIRVNALLPVASGTPMLKEFMGGVETPEQRERFISSIPLGRLSDPRDIANAALYLASDDANFITGVCLEVDGGRCI